MRGYLMDFKKEIKNICHKMTQMGALHITIGTFLTKFVAFFGSIAVVRLMSKNEYGLMGYAENIYSYALIFAGAGLSNAVTRYLIISKDAGEKKKFFVYIVRTGIFINIIIAVLMCLAGLSADIPSNYSDAKYLIPIAALLLPLQDLVNAELYTLRAFFMNKLYAVAAFVTSFLLIAGRITGAVKGGAAGVFWSRVLLNAIFAFAGFVYIWKKFFSGYTYSALNRSVKKDVISFSVQYMITNGFWAVLMLNDAFMLGQLLNDPGELADYKAACVLPGNISVFATAIGTFIAPYFIKNETDTEWVQKWFKKTYVITMTVAGTATLLVILLAEPLITLMYGEQYLNITDVMRVLLVGAFINSGLRYTTANLLAAMGQVKYNMIVSGTGILIQLVMDYVLIPRMGIMAVAVTDCVVFLMMAVVLLVVFYHMYYKRGCEG